MKKIGTFICLCLSFAITHQSIYASGCDFDVSEWWNLTEAVEWCIKKWQVTVESKDLVVWRDTNDIINDLIQNIWVILTFWAVIMIVYAGLLMTLSWGNDEKVKKGKDLLKWTLIGYIALLTAGGIVSFIIGFIYDIAWW